MYGKAGRGEGVEDAEDAKDAKVVEEAVVANTHSCI